jgi:enoyl-CoA hydratase
MTTQTETPVLVSVRHHTGVLQLNRPRALNSLTPEMVEIITGALEKWRDDESVTQVLITSTSPKAFCAGGDVRHAREEILAGQEERADRFFSDEYAMNHLIAGYPKPYIAVIDGITMGGGLGVSAHGSHRVSTEKAWASMPEMAIGYITDVGISYASQRWPGSSPALGAFIGLTGYRMTAADMLYCGLATHVVADAGAFTEDAVRLGVEEALATHAAGVKEESRLAEWRDSIEEIFSAVTWSDIDAALKTHADQDFVTAVRVLMSGGSPSAIIATTELYAANRDVADLRHGLDNEERLGEFIRRQPDFLEGVRAVLVDKTRDPQFSPAPDPNVYRAVLQ